MEELQLKKLILDTVTDKSGRFNYNDAYQISWNVGCNFELIKNILDSFIEKGIIKKFIMIHMKILQLMFLLVKIPMKYL